jgi:hypothetical protein
MSQRDDDREADLRADDSRVLPDQTLDDTDRGWGDDQWSQQRADSNDERLRRERPPHWG